MQIGIIPRQIQVLIHVDELINSQRLNITEQNIDEIFFQLVNGGCDIDLDFQNIINPFSNELHLALFDLHTTKLIECDPILKVTPLGKKFINDFIQKYHFDINKHVIGKISFCF